MAKAIEIFEVYSKGNIMSGYVTFWKTKKTYMRQAIGKPVRCSKKLYDEAKALYRQQQREEA